MGWDEKMEIAEPIAALVATPDEKEKCWACEQDPPDERHNSLDESPSSIGDPENDLHNDSSTLGKNLGFRPSWTISVPDSQGGEAVTRTCEVLPGAHHLIPGNASLKKVPSILDLMESSRGKIQSDIGYDVNSAQNGVWLPANYGVNINSAFGKKWSQYQHQNDYAIAAMKRAGAQFHDAHPEYSDKVKTTLRALADKINLKKPEVCAICGKQISDKSRPPYGLVGRLNRVSRQHHRFLAGPVRKWPVDSGYFTSSRSALMK
jgi:hypothetical protein